MSMLKRYLALVVTVVLLLIGINALKPQQVGAQGPPQGLGVQVLNTPLAVTGSTTVSGSVDASQSGDWKVSVAQHVFYQSAQPTCDVTNRCQITTPTVAAGKRLRVTRIQGFARDVNFDAFAVLNLDGVGGGHEIVATPLKPFAAAYKGFVLSFDQSTDAVIEAGHTATLELGAASSFTGPVKLSITGELLDAQ